MFVEDLTPFFDAAAFATPATLAGVAVVGLFDNSYFEQDMGGSGSAVAYTLPSASVPANAVGLLLVLGAVTYKVVEVMPDGTGVTTLRLRT